MLRFCGGAAGATPGKQTGTEAVKIKQTGRLPILESHNARTRLVLANLQCFVGTFQVPPSSRFRWEVWGHVLMVGVARCSFKVGFFAYIRAAPVFPQSTQVTDSRLQVIWAGS